MLHVEPSPLNDGSSPPTSPEGDHPADADALFATFVQHRDVCCPRCDYNLRNALNPACPECGEPLRLTVEVVQPFMGLFLAFIAPGVFCGLGACVLVLVMLLHPGAPVEVVLTAFGMFISGCIAATVIVRKRTFMRQTRDRQLGCVILTWAVHLIALVIFLASTM